MNRIWIWPFFFYYFFLTGYGPVAGGPNAQGAKPAGKAGTKLTLNIINVKIRMRSGVSAHSTNNC